MREFDPDLVCAEENELLHELRRRGEVMLYEPTLSVLHERRPTIKQFGSQMCKYGRGRGQLIRRVPTSARLAYMVPLLLVLYLCVAAGAVALLGPIALVPALLYVLLIMAEAAQIGITLHDPRAIPYSMGLLVLVHTCYGFGVGAGLSMPGVVGDSRSTLHVESH